MKEFWQKVNITGPDDCWEWKFGRRRDIYPTFRGEGGHRFALQLKLGRKLRPGFYALHTCDNKRCVNPKHLFEGTGADNTRDMMKKGRSKFGGEPVLTKELVVKLRQLYATGLFSCRELAEMAQLKQGTLWAAIKGWSWKDVGGPIQNQPMSTGARRRMEIGYTR